MFILYPYLLSFILHPQFFSIFLSSSPSTFITYTLSFIINCLYFIFHYLLLLLYPTSLTFVFIFHPSSFNTLLYPSSFIIYHLYFFLHPLSFIIYTLSFILSPSSFILHHLYFILSPLFFIIYHLYFILYPLSFTIFTLSFIIYHL